MSLSKNIQSALFEAAASLEDVAERQTFFDLTCKGNPELRSQLQELIALSGQADQYLSMPEVRIPVEISRLAVVEGEEGANAGQFCALVGGGASIGRYRLLRRMGEGGCGVVYVAEQLEPVQRQVALKIIRLGMDTERVVARFEVERQAAAMMDHPNIARVLDAGTTSSGRPFFVMEMVDGDRITDFCKSHAMALRPRLELFIQVCKGIQHAHQKGIIHRDIKPSNVLVRQVDGVAFPKVIDFGIAKEIGCGKNEDLSTTAGDPQFLGTPTYMSPEQAAGHPDVDTRSDIYSLGALLYEILCGKPPFDPLKSKDSGIEEVRRIAYQDRSEPLSAAIGTRHRTDLGWIVAKAMAKDRNERYDTAIGLAADVRRFLNNEPVIAAPQKKAYLLGKLIRRHKITVIASTVTVMALLAAAGVSTRLYFRERTAREAQSRLRDRAEIARLNEGILRQDAEFRSLTSQAAVQIAHQNFEEADKLLAKVPIDRTPPSLEAATSFETLANWHLLAGHWQEAAGRYSSYARAVLTVDHSDNDSVSRSLAPAAAAVCFTGDSKGYESIRTLALARFKDTRHPIVAEQLIKVALLRPADESILKSLRPLAEVLEKAIDQKGSPVASNEHQAWWGCFALALMNYRDGKLDQARAWVERCVSSNKLSEVRSCSVDILLAMIESRSGNPQLAQSFLSKASNQVVKKTGALVEFGANEQGYWHTWVIARILRNEAAAMINQ